MLINKEKYTYFCPWYLHRYISKGKKKRETSFSPSIYIYYVCFSAYVSSHRILKMGRSERPYPIVLQRKKSRLKSYCPFFKLLLRVKGNHLIKLHISLADSSNSPPLVFTGCSDPFIPITTSFTLLLVTRCYLLDSLFQFIVYLFRMGLSYLCFHPL